MGIKEYKHKNPPELQKFILPRIIDGEREKRSA